MRFSLAVILICLSYCAISQTKVWDKVGKVVGINLNTVPPPVQLDSCYYLHTLLKIKVSEKSKIDSLMFSDNAPGWLADNLKTVYPKINLQLIEVLKDEEIQNTDLIFPIIIQTINFPCQGVLPNDMIVTEKYFQFQQENIAGKVIFYKPLVFAFYPPDIR